VRRFIPIVMVILTSFIAHAESGPKPVFIMAKCDGKLSSVVLSGLKDAVSASQKYRLVSSLDDNSYFDTVQTIHLTCVENSDVTAVAMHFGIAKCHSKTVCHSVVDGISLNAALCNASLSIGCVSRFSRYSMPT